MGQFANFPLIDFENGATFERERQRHEKPKSRTGECVSTHNHLQVFWTLKLPHLHFILSNN